MKWSPKEWLRPRGKWAQSAKYWATVPRSAMFVVLAGISCLFAAFGLMITLISVRHATTSVTLIMALEVGLFAGVLAWAALHAYLKAIIVIAVVHAGAIFWIAGMLNRHDIPLTASPADFLILERRTQTAAVAATFLIFAGYSLLSAFMRKEGMRGFGVVTELRLATEIHRALVPPLSRTIHGFEICGSSTPSGQMGGDLVDVIENGDRWTAYVADVSGHGVPAGMIMAMVKSAVRMGSASNEPMAATLANLNRVLASICASNVFITFACIAGAGDSQVQFSLAGHLPVLHYRKRLGSVEERTVSNLPLAVMPDNEFQTASIECEPGDLLAVLTDGLTEVSNSHGDELGLEPFKTALLSNSNASLEAIITNLQATATRHGKQLDDQTVLLVRHMG